MKLFNKLKDNALEYFTLLIIEALLPLVAYLYFDFRASLLIFAVCNIIIGVFALRNKK